jgi:glycosyltransferase involved in cell wall biosynthesis
MKILMFAPQFAPVVGGAERQAEKLGQELSSQGLDVQVVTPLLVSGSPLHEVRGGLVVRRFKLHDLAETLRLPGIGLINIPWMIMQIVAALWHEVGRTDLVHCHIGSLQSLAAALVARLRGKPVICKAAMAHERSDLGEMGRNGFLSRLLAKTGRVAFTKWIATSEAVRLALIRAGVCDSRIAVIPNGVEVMPITPSARNSKVQRFLYLGRLSSNIERDVPRLIDAFDSVASRSDQIQLAIVGDGDLRADALRQAQLCRYASKIQLPGTDNASKWLDWADAFVLPSKREGLSNALLEAMSHGLPCIATDIPPNREVLSDGHCGLLVPVNDTRALEIAMIRLIKDHELAMGLRDRALKQVKEKYSLSTIGAKYVDLYKILVQKN